MRTCTRDAHPTCAPPPSHAHAVRPQAACRPRGTRLLNLVGDAVAVVVAAAAVVVVVLHDVGHQLELSHRLLPVELESTLLHLGRVEVVARVTPPAARLPQAGPPSRLLGWRRRGRAARRGLVHDHLLGHVGLDVPRREHCGDLGSERLVGSHDRAAGGVALAHPLQRVRPLHALLVLRIEAVRRLAHRLRHLPPRWRRVAQPVGVAPRGGAGGGARLLASSALGAAAALVLQLGLGPRELPRLVPHQLVQPRGLHHRAEVL